VLRINGTTIEIHKGNAGTFTIKFTGSDIPADNDKIIFIVKKSPESSPYIIRKELYIQDNILTVNFDSKDTANLNVDIYYWNLIIEYDNGTSPWTVMRFPGRFIVTPMIGGKM